MLMQIDLTSHIVRITSTIKVTMLSLSPLASICYATHTTFVWLRPSMHESRRDCNEVILAKKLGTFKTYFL